MSESSGTKKDFDPIKIGWLGACLDGEGGYTVFGALVAADRSASGRLLPIGLSDGLALRRDVRRGQRVTLDDVEPLPPGRTVELRAEMVAGLGSNQRSPA